MKTFSHIDWSQYDDAYGVANNVPQLLKSLIQKEEKAWFNIWSHLCHQGTVYSATFIAIPFIVDFFAKNIEANKEDFDYYLFAASVELFFYECEIDIGVFNLNPEEIQSYYQSLELLDSIIPQFLKENTNSDCVLSALSYQAVRTKQFTLSQFLINVDKNQLPNFLEKIYE